MSSGRRWEPPSSEFTKSDCRLSALSHCERRPLIRQSMLDGYVPLRPNTHTREVGQVPLSARFALPGWCISLRFTQQLPPWKRWGACCKDERSHTSSVTRICIQPICSVILSVTCL